MPPVPEPTRPIVRAATAFRAAFGHPADGPAAVAPGRINLIGEHTDYNDGLVLPVAIQLCCAAVTSRRADSRLRIVAADLVAPGNVFECDLAALHPTSFRATWAAYAAGPGALLFAMSHARTGADVAIASDVPMGSGLSSSGAMEVAIATALAALWKVHIAPLDLARLCQRAEHEFAGVPCGLMDQLAAVFGREGHALLMDCRDGTIVPIPLPTSETAALVVTNSGVRHALASGEYARRRAACESAAGVMGLRSLRDASTSAIAGARLTPQERDCAAHVVAENARVGSFAAALRAGDRAGAGAQMYASHASLRDLFRVSCPELDTLVEIAHKVPGVYGSRMTGGGFGGCTITLCHPGAVSSLTLALREEYRAAHGRECSAFVVRACAGARIVQADADSCIT